MLQYINKDYTD